MARRVTAAAAKPAAKQVALRRTAKVTGKAAVKVVAKSATKSPAVPATAKESLAAGRGTPKAAPKASKAPPPPVRPITVTLKHLAADLSESFGLPKRDTETFATALFGDLIAYVKAGAKVRIARLGVIEIKARPARMARNPATGEPVQVAASRKIVFRAAKELKDAL